MGHVGPSEGLDVTTTRTTHGSPGTGGPKLGQHILARIVKKLMQPRVRSISAVPRAVRDTANEGPHADTDPQRGEEATQRIARQGAQGDADDECEGHVVSLG